jgi:hypothetical protein
MNEELLKEILQEIKNVHFHLEQLIGCYIAVNKIEIKEKEDS